MRCERTDGPILSHCAASLGSGLADSSPRSEASARRELPHIPTTDLSVPVLVSFWREAGVTFSRARGVGLGGVLWTLQITEVVTTRAGR